MPGGGRHGAALATATVTLAVSLSAVMPATPGSAQVGASAHVAGKVAGAAVAITPFGPPIWHLAHGRLFSGTPAVGALFHLSHGRLGRHFCTATVVSSPSKDLIITAAHCVSKTRPSQIAFVPGYHSGIEPYGVWAAAAIVVDSIWLRTADPNHDVAFLTVHQAGNSIPIQDLTGSEHLGISWRARQRVRVIGYQDDRDRPIACQAFAHPPSRPGLPAGYEDRQVEFDCADYTEGTSGGPFLARISARNGAGTVVGVIGGWQEGGDTAAVSYSTRFGAQVKSLYEAAVLRG